jgi:signal transduction histidine kinase
LVLFANHQLLGQKNSKIDSLKFELSHASGSSRCDLLLKLSTEYLNVDNPKSLELAGNAYSLAIDIGDSLIIIKGARLLGRVYRASDNLLESINWFNKALAISERNATDKEVAEEYKLTLNSIAITYTYFADYVKALEYNFKCLELREREGNKAEISIVLNNIGLVYFKLRNYQRAIVYYKKSLAYKHESKDYFDLDLLYINIGLCYNQIKDFKSSQENFEAAFNVCKNDCSNRIKMEGEFGLGVSNYGQGNFAEATKHFNTSISIATEISNNRFRGENLVYLGKVYISQDEPKLAETALAQAEALASKSNYKELLIDTYRQFSLLYNKTKNFENAAIYQTKYISLKDSVYNELLIENISKVQLVYAERENIKTIAAKEEVIQRQRSLNFAIVVIAVLATLLIFVLYRSIQVKKKVNAALSEAKAIIEEQNKQLLNSNINLDKELKEKNIDLEKANESLRRVNDELDNFIYKTSHDIRGPLASLKGMCNVALMDVKDPVALNYLRKLDVTAEKLNTILTRLLIVNQINNSTLATEPIDFEAIVNDVLLLERKKGMPANLLVKKNIGPLIEFSSDKEFVRIILENLIDNAIKFYNDSARVDPFVDITIVTEGEFLKIRVVDNGIGISEAHPDKIFQMFSRASERSETGGIGLYITKTAAHKLGGMINLNTTPEGFTEFSVKLPLTASNVTA